MTHPYPIKTRWNEYSEPAGDGFGQGYKAYFIRRRRGWDLALSFLRALPTIRLRWPFYFPGEE